MPTYPLTVNRRSDARILEVANRLAAPLYDAHDAVAPRSRPSPAPTAGVVTTAVFETQRRRARLAGRGRPGARTPTTGSWSDIGVLTRDNAHAEDVFDALTAAGVPVEIVGLSGPAPAARGGRGRRDAAPAARRHRQRRAAHAAHRPALGDRAARPAAARRARRASSPAAPDAGAAPTQGADVDDQLVAIADGIDPAEIPALGDALDDPGDAAYSAEARERFALLAAELRMLRSHVGEPLLDVVRRIIDTTGVDIELASAVSPAAAARRDNLDLFVKAVAEFQAVDGDVTPGGAAGLPDGRGRAGQRPRRRDARPRPTRSSC